jgi:hypothetical protein
MAAWLPLLNSGKTAVSFHAAGTYCRARLKLNICVRIGLKITEQPLMMKPGISSSLRDFECCSLLMALQISASETGTRDRNSEHCERRGRSIGLQLLWTDWKCLAKASATAVGSAKYVPSTFSWIEPDVLFLKLHTYFQKCWCCDFKFLQWTSQSHKQWYNKCVFVVN